MSEPRQSPDARGIEEEAQDERKRKKIVASFLLGNALISIGLLVLFISTGSSEKKDQTLITSTIIDLALAAGLFAQKEVLKLVFARSALGLLFFGGASLIAQDWFAFAVQLAYSGFLMYFTWVKPSKKINKIRV